MKHFGIWTIVFLGILLFTSGCSDDDPISTGPVGWAIGWRSDDTAAILHTNNGGKTWVEQGDTALWPGMAGNDISAVDPWTAWAALGSAVGSDAPGAILHTTDGGANWRIQPLPEGVNDDVKGIKGLSPSVAWAVTLGGTVMRTLDGGETWVVIPHEGITMVQVNRIDAKGEDIWIADFGSGENGMIHSPDFGQTWRQETLPDPDPLPDFGPMAVSIVSSEVVWASTRPAANLYRTTDGGAVWSLDAPDISGPNDLDDVCAPNADLVWAVQNLSGDSGGRIIKVRMEDGKVISDVMDPTGKYLYEGVTCFDEKTAWAVGLKAIGVSPDLPDGVILLTADGGANWVNQPMPVKDVSLWKVSFVGAHR
jgi:photosystem II stability/assembly factor-like uncharacterized protein